MTIHAVHRTYTYTWCSMANMKAWTTKGEVLNDIAKASGRSAREKDEFDEGYLVIGDAPPPVIPEDQDAEMKILFGDAVSKKLLPTEEDTAPDLAGIQQMIRMIEKYNSEGDENINDGPVNSENCVIAISKVSKLNPHVGEFIPRGLISPSRQLADQNINSNFVKQTVERSEESKKKTKLEIKGKEGGDNNDLGAELNVDKEEYEDMATALKNQISDAAKSDSYEFKKQKNVAIATLLKLYAKNKSPPKCAAPVKLITPEYFEGKVESHPDVKIGTPLEIVSTESCSTPEPRGSSTTLPSCSTFSTSTSSTNPTSPKKKIDPEIKKSIDKVNKWLEEPKMRKSPAVCLGPIAFKRKEPVSSKSPVSDSSPKARKPVAASQQYQPSKYAADLGQKYEQRNKVLESKLNEVTWTNLGEVLKAKDVEIKKRQEQEQASTSGS